ncbi:hypothetical protein [Myxococcus sp. SDU36]|uniref:hypothetical protein n=1 Tax=Myxococcus sp. SDU36 TaxID=2831967 RepID=UPI0025439474|nr:hypothetical protein [Myxococcus sp. SDU36]WIG94650.1 hypothetical protein KGD87_29675 [Myxococcus sp. SDU36]
MSNPPASSNPPPAPGVIEPWEYHDTEGFNAAARLHSKSVQEILAPCATQHDAGFELHSAIVELHRTMRQNYLRMVHRVGRNIHPLIIARDTEPEMDRADLGRQGVGGSYTLYLENGETYSVRPTPRAYELLKCLAHIPLGLFTLLSPYFQNATATSWMEATRLYQRQIRTAIESFTHGAESLDASYRPWVQSMLELTDAYVEQTLRKRSVTVEDYEAYTTSMRPHIRLTMDTAAKLQVDAVMAAMLRWKQMLGPAEWKKLYVVVPTIWPVAEYNPRWQIFRSIMDPAEVELRLLVANGVTGPNIEEQIRDLLGRIVADRASGRLVFGIEDERGRRMTQGLSSPTDVLADSAHEALQEFSARFSRGCPVAHGIKDGSGR